MYSLRALPIGGYCAMQGEDGKTAQSEQQREFRQSGTHESDNFQAKSPWQRLAIVVAGPVANFILCFLILLVAALAFGVQGNKEQAVVGPMIAGLPAQKAGLHVGDRIVTLDGKPVTGGDELVKVIHGSLGKPIAIGYQRNGVVKTVNVTPAVCPKPNPPGQGCIGFTPIGAYSRVGFTEAVRDSFIEFDNIATQTIGGLVMLVSHPQRYAGGVHSIVGIGQAATTIQDFGWGMYLGFAATISFALGLFNLLPIPALDGGRGAFIIAELFRGKPVDPEREAMVHIAGFAALLAFIAIVTFRDIANIVQGKGIF
jgi:regulator of sigma E protease